MRFRVDDIVKIRKKSKWYRDDDTNNPKNTEGKIVCINTMSRLTVRWDNNKSNGYMEEDLGLVRRT